MTRTLAPRSRPARLTAAALALLAGLALSGCGQARAGAAAFVGDERISVNDLHETVSAVLDQRKGPTPRTEVAKLQRDTLTRKIVTIIVDDAATRQGITVRNGEIDQRIAEVVSSVGGRKQLDAGLLQDGVNPADLPELVRQSIVIGKIGERLVPGSGPNVQLERQRKAGEYLTRLAERVGVTVSPRYGTWDPKQATLAPASDDLSRPAKGTSAPQQG